MRQNSHERATASASEHNAEYAKDSQPDTEGLGGEVGAKGEVVGKVGATPDLLQEVPLGRLALG